MANNPKIKFALVCDDTRREDTGKLIFIGVYAQNILVGRLPAKISLALAIWFESSDSFNGSFSSRVWLNDEIITTGEGSISIEGGEAIAAMPRMPLIIKEEGLLKFDVKLGDAEWQTAATMPVVLRPAIVSDPTE